MSETWTIKRLLDWSHTFLERYGSESPRLDAELLLVHVLELRRMDLYVQFDRPLQADELERFKALIKRRARHEPVAYILGTKGFHAIDLAVGPGVLVPRPETEHLVDAAIAFLKEPSCPTGPLVDVGTGSGAVALAVATALGPARPVVATERSPVAARYARQNAEVLGLDVPVLEGDLLGPALEHGPFAAVVSNPPYIRSDVMPALAATVRDHEPHLALDGGPAGLDVLRRLVVDAPRHLQPGGLFAVELGSRAQGDEVAAWLTDAGFSDAAYTAIGPGPTGLVQARWRR